jgi:hypothetical protein
MVWENCAYEKWLSWSEDGKISQGYSILLDGNGGIKDVG